MRFVLGPGGVDYRARLTTLVGYFVAARVLRGETLLGIGPSGSLHAAALISRPDGLPSPTALGALREDVWRQLGSDARARYEAFSGACAAFVVEEGHLHLNMIGVRRGLRGQGLGRRLAEFVHETSRADVTSTGVTLTTEDERNVSLYEHLGYELVGSAVVAPELSTWGFFRADGD
jgi:ribosomal protein S18 acetylase RimI-like enzyme